MTPQPIETAPKNGGWVLGLVLAGGWTKTDWQPWVPLTWGDSGWMDDDGYPREATAWVPLPDPQPRPTGWRPAEGSILVAEISGDGWTSNGKPIEVPYRWSISIERNDGSLDDYREGLHCVTREEAEATGMRWSQKYGLPAEVIPLPPAENVIQILPRPGR
jgi:hypothetical protein